MSRYDKSNFILRFACFLTFTNYSLLKECSEVSKRKILQYFSGLIIICCVWLFVGFGFTWLYVNKNILWSLVTGFVSVIIVLQIERSIIVGNTTKTVLFFRLIIGLLLAFIGAIVVDQILFKNDIELMKKSKEYKAEVAESVSMEMGDINERKQILINQRDSLSGVVLQIQKEKDFTIAKNIQTVSVLDTTIGVWSETMKEQINKSYRNRNKDLAVIYVERIKNFDYLLDSLDNQASNIQINAQEYFESKRGFLTDILLLKKVLINKDSKKNWYLGLIVYSIFFFLFLMIELFILVIKTGDPKTDYDVLIKFQESVKIKRIQNLDP